MLRACLLSLLALWALQVQAADSPVDFDKHIRPLLSDNCFSCHGPDAAQRQADLRLDRRDDAVAAGALDPKNLTTSSLLNRILSDKPDEVMPPPKSNKHLSEAQKELLRKWVEQGAQYTQHWAFLPPVRPTVPPTAHPIDFLVEAQLTREGLTFSSPADPITLARRLSLDLVGLPPNLPDVQRLTADPSPARFNAYIDQLLASPHYGERMSINWLDVVRFADTIGYHSDTPRNVYPYRDYVIGAFNSNKPFDLFTLEQIAGDLLPDATQEQKVASCFNRLLLTTEEGGAQAKDYEARYLGDRVRAIGTTWLGLTIGCSQCHDHKFDPVTMQDFYSMGAFFADIDEAIIGRREDGLVTPTPTQAIQLQQYKVALATLQTEFNSPHPRLAAEQAAWEQQQLALADAWQVLSCAQCSATGTAESAPPQFQIQSDQSVLVSGPRRNFESYEVVLTNAQPQASNLAALRLEVLPHESLPGGGSGRASNGNFVLNEVSGSIVHADGSTTPLKFAAARASIEQTAAAEQHPDKKWSAASTIDNDARGKEWGWAILPDVTKPQELQLKLDQPVDIKSDDKLVILMHQQHGNDGHVLGHFRWSVSANSQAFDAPLTSAQAALIAILKTPAAERKPEQLDKIRAEFQAVTPALAELRTRIATAQKELDAFQASLPRCLISRSMPQPRVVRILPRGNWQDESGPIVQPRLPAFLTSSQSPIDRPLNRLDLARRLISPEHPLTARVFVNRLWKQFFGIGLSKTLDDVGAQGEAPTNGPLLDYLATEFVSSGWNIKHMVRLIVTSRAYQQTSDASPELLARDPENRLIARQSRFRLPAELVRDNALAISGLLSPEVGGPSVKPYQPEGYWENLNFPPRNYEADPAPLQHRRGLYVWWQRSFVHPSMLAFDAPTREECAADRPQSNIPQQALVLLNDPTFVEAAKSLARRVLASDSRTPDEQLVQAFVLATARQPNPQELSLLMKLYEISLKQYAEDRAAAEAITGKSDTNPSQLAAMVQACRAILNLHEVITRN